MIIVNHRCLSSGLTGVQRYTQEISRRIENKLSVVSPNTPLKGVRGHLWEQFILPKKLGSDLLWSPCNTGPLCVEKQVVSIMDVLPLDHPEWFSRNFSLWYQFLIPRLVNRVRAVLTISEYSKQRILKYCPNAEGKVHVTPLAADSMFQPKDSHSINDALTRLEFPTDQYFFALASLAPRKNQKRLLEAWSRIYSTLPSDVWLVLAGAKGDPLVFGEHSVLDLPPRVHLTGHVPDELLPALYSGAIATVYLSLCEGFGLPPLESMSCGTPVLVSNLSSLPEVVGEAGLYANPYDTDDICQKLIALIENPRLRFELRRRGINQAQRFSWDNASKKTADVLMSASA